LESNDGSFETNKSKLNNKLALDVHKIPIEELYRYISSSKNGLSSAQAKERLEKYGPNMIEEKEKVSPIIKFLKNFTNFFAILLTVGSILAFIAEYLTPGEGNLYIGIALVAVVILNAIFTFIQEYQSEKIMDSFKKMMPTKIQVLRDEKRVEIFAKDVVSGDIMFLSEGDKIPADGRLIEHHALKVDNSSLTGESEPQLRSIEPTNDNILESRNMVFSGTLVQSGTGTAIIYGTGMKTQIGNIANLTKTMINQITPMHREINHFISIISTIAIILGILFFFVSIALGNPFISSLIFAIGIIVANVPEGLLPTVTLALSIASRKMAKKKALIKNLESVETLGSTTVICTDKTGTITQNKMFVNSVFINHTELSHHNDFSKVDGSEKLFTACVLCNNSKLDGEKYIGDPTEGALLLFASDYINIDEINSNHERLDEDPFSSDTKCMITTNRFDRSKVEMLKGAPEVVLDKCSHILLNDKQVLLDDNSIHIIQNHYRKMASRGERVLGVGYRESKKTEKFVFVGLVGIIDPPRPEIPSAIAKCKEAGIRVIMITGDYTLTAEAIAKQVGILSSDKNIVIDGAHLASMSETELREIVKKNNLIFARTSPSQKLRIVKALQSNDEIVAVTGDGVNDAPALKNADIGVAMVIIGTEVSKEASDMVLLDDNFATIVKAVEQGRTIYANIKKFIAYILTSNIPEILPFIAFVLLGIPLPLTVILILAIDLGTDLIPALGLGNEKSESDVMKQPPRLRKERLLTRQMLTLSYGVIGVIQAAAGFAAYFYVLYVNSWTWGQQLAFTDPVYLKAITAFFASIVICQIPDVIICRTRHQSIFTHGLFSNKLIWIGIGVELLLVGFISHVPFANTFFGTAPIGINELLIPIPFAILTFVWDEFRKLMIRRGNKFFKRNLAW